MVRLTAMKIRRMGAGVRQIDVKRDTGICTSRLSLLENGLAEPTERERGLIESFMLRAEKVNARQCVEENVSL